MITSSFAGERKKRNINNNTANVVHKQWWYEPEGVDKNITQESGCKEIVRRSLITHWTQKETEKQFNVFFFVETFVEAVGNQRGMIEE
jgi:hypothetical protein